MSTRGDRILEEAAKLAEELTDAITHHQQLRACWSCGHEMHFHDPAPQGCSFVALVSRPGISPRCACGIEGA